MTLEDLNKHLLLREKLEKAQEMLVSLRAAAQAGEETRPKLRAALTALGKQLNCD